MISFERNRNIKEALDIGIAKELPVWMRNSGFDYTKYGDVWLWAMNKHLTKEPKDFIFPYIVSLRGTKWHNDIIEFGMETNNELLWQSVDVMCYPAVKAILEIPNLFSEEVFNMNIGASPTSEHYYRGEHKVQYRATNFGSFVQLAMAKSKDKDWRILDALKDYYKKYKKEDV